jgi:hypothetical protein
LPARIPYIDDAINQGRTVVVPQSNIQLNQWQGVGWIVLNPATGSAGYYILGSLAHPSATMVKIAGGSGTTPANDGDWFNMPLKIHDLLTILGLIDIGAVLVATGLGNNVLGPLGAELGLAAALAGSPLFAAGVVCLGAAMIAAGVFFAIQLLTASNLNYSRRRWYALSGRVVTIS